MNTYVGIDLGTTNSAICSYNSIETRIWKSPEQNDVTPSVIYVDKRGNKHVGKRAYDSAPQNPNNAAMLFKRLMGTNTPIRMAGKSKTPEECSAEILKVIYGYLPEEIRNDPETGTVITVPAAFNQMQKEATRQAAEMAGIGKVALMQEPVAAVMSVMRQSKTDGIFLIYDLGGGTLDVAVAENIGGRVNLLAHGGIAMCGGRDFDRMLVDNVVRPWLMKNFTLPDNLPADPDYKSLLRLAAWASERAKIELSASEKAVISLTETETRIKDLNGNEIYVEIELDRKAYDKLIDSHLRESIDAARETLESAGLFQDSLDRIVFIGGPTNYKPLRDKVCFELGIKGSTDVNPMTAVAEGASLFAESIDWKSETRGRKVTRGELTSDVNVKFKYISRTPGAKTKIVVQLATEFKKGFEFQIDGMETGWSSGRMPLTNNASVEVTLSVRGNNRFKVFVFDQNGRPVKLKQDMIEITRTTATIDAIPSSHSVSVEVLEKVGGVPIPDFLIRSGESLPKKGKKTFKAAESLKAGSYNSLNFKIWEGEISDPITDNRPIGLLKISGRDFDRGVIPAGADLECEFEILDSGNIILEVSVPSIGGTFHSGKNFYSRQEGQLDFTMAAGTIIEEARQTQERLHEMAASIHDPKIETALGKLSSAVFLNPNETETEITQKAMDNVYEAKRLLAKVRKEHLKEIRKIELDREINVFNSQVKNLATVSEINAWDNMVKLAQRSIEHNDNEFESQIHEIRNIIFRVLWRQDWFVLKLFKSFAGSPFQYADRALFDNLTALGNQCLQRDEFDKLRDVVMKLAQSQIARGGDSDMFEMANIIRG